MACSFKQVIHKLNKIKQKQNIIMFIESNVIGLITFTRFIHVEDEFVPGTGRKLTAFFLCNLKL